MNTKFNTLGPDTAKQIKPSIPDLAETWTDSSRYVSNKLTYFDADGATAVPTKVWMDNVTPNTGNGFTVDISSAGFTNISSVSITPFKFTTTPADIPRVAIKTITETALVLNIVDSNTAAFATVTNLNLWIEIKGN